MTLQALASDGVHDDQRGRLMSLVIAIGQIGMALGAGIAGWIYTDLGFMGNATLAASASFIMAILIYRYITDRKVAIGE